MPVPTLAAAAPTLWRKRLLLPLLAVLLLTLAGVLLVLREEKKTEAARLQALADAKAQQLADWVRERRGDLRVLGSGGFLGDLHHRWRVGGDAEAGALLAARLAQWRMATGADVMLLLDPQGGVAWSSQRDADPDLDAATLADLPSTGSVRGPRAIDGRVAVDFLVPLPVPASGRSPVLLMRVWAETALLPLLTRWPLPSATGEARLAWRTPDGPGVSILRAVRESSAYRAGLLPATPESPAARMVRGEVAPGQAFEGVDPLGRAYLVVGRPVPGTPWYLLTGVAQSEIRRNAVLPAALVSLAGAMALLAAASLMRLGFKQRELQALERLRRSEAASEAKSRFLAHMSHEIRTPLNAVIGLSQLLARMELPDQARGFVGHIGLAGEQLLALTNDVLDLSRIESGELLLEQVPFELPALLETVHALVQAQAAAKGLALRFEPALALPRVLIGDPLRVRQVLLNLLGNAVKFTPQGSVTLRVSSPRHNGAHCCLRLDVLDTGIGIEPALHSRIFEPFAQGDPSTTRRFGGTGLGLSIVTRLVALMGGQLHLHSVPGQGSTFSVTLPFALPADGA